jgi:hypothetical protein
MALSLVPISRVLDDEMRCWIMIDPHELDFDWRMSRPPEGYPVRESGRLSLVEQFLIHRRKHEDEENVVWFGRNSS